MVILIRYKSNMIKTKKKLYLGGDWLVKVDLCFFLIFAARVITEIIWKVSLLEN